MLDPYYYEYPTNNKNEKPNYVVSYYLNGKLHEVESYSVEYAIKLVNTLSEDRISASISVRN